MFAGLNEHFGLGNEVAVDGMEDDCFFLSVTNFPNNLSEVSLRDDFRLDILLSPPEGSTSH